MGDDEVVVRRELHVDAPVGDVWDAVADLGWVAPEAELDLRPGSSGWLRDDDGVTRRAEVDEVDAGHRLAFRWWGAGEAERQVTVTLAPEGAGARLIVVERPAVPTARACSALLVSGVERLVAVAVMARVGALG